MTRKTTIAGSLIVLAVLVLAIAIAVTRFGEREPSVIARPWVNTPYRDLPDSTLMEKAGQKDTLAAMVLSWHYMDTGDTLRAADFLSKFNPNPETASADLNYMSARSFMATGRNNEAIRYLLPIAGYKAYPNARIYLANVYNKVKNYEQALAVYQQINDEYLVGRDDSILVCKGNMDDTVSAMKFAMKMMDEGQPVKGARFFDKYVSFSRGVSPTSWSYAAGMAFLQGNNPTRAAVFLENADAETTFADLSYNLGMAYYRIEAYDSSASKLTQAMELGDTSINLLTTLIRGYKRAGLSDKAFETSMFAIGVHPECEDFYFTPAMEYYDKKQYDSLLAFVIQARKNVSDSYKIDSYYAAANYLVGNNEKADAFVDTLIMKYKFQAGALGDAARLFEKGLGRTDIAQRLIQNDPGNIFPEAAGFLNYYNQLKSEGLTDSCRTILENWISNDSVEARRQLIVELYNKDFPDSTEK